MRGGAGLVLATTHGSGDGDQPVHIISSFVLVKNASELLTSFLEECTANLCDKFRMEGECADAHQWRGGQAYFSCARCAEWHQGQILRRGAHCDASRLGCDPLTMHSAQSGAGASEVVATRVVELFNDEFLVHLFRMHAKAENPIAFGLFVCHIP